MYMYMYINISLVPSQFPFFSMQQSLKSWNGSGDEVILHVYVTGVPEAFKTLYVLLQGLA